MNILKKLMLIYFSILSLSIFSSTISTSLENATPTPKFAIGVGSIVKINSDDNAINSRSVFLGKTIQPSGQSSYQIFLNQTSKKIFFISNDEIENKKMDLQTILDPYEQTGGTCAGYAIYDFLLQTNLTGSLANNELSKTLSTEEGRTLLLADAINQYYLTLSHRYSMNGIMNGYGKKFGFKCSRFKSDTLEKTKTSLLKTLRAGSPVIVSYNIGPKMVNSPFKMELYNQKNNELDDRLWIPRKVGERNSGGHSIVASSTFSFEGKNYLVMIDSDWSEPRIWDVDEYLGSKTALDEIEFISCK